MSWVATCEGCGRTFGLDRIKGGRCAGCRESGPADAPAAFEVRSPETGARALCVPEAGGEAERLRGEVLAAVARAEKAEGEAEALRGDVELMRLNVMGAEAQAKATLAASAKAKAAAKDWREKAEAARAALPPTLAEPEAEALRAELAEAREALRREKSRMGEREVQLTAKLGRLDAEATRLRAEIAAAHAVQAPPETAALAEAERRADVAERALAAVRAKLAAATAPRGELARTGMGPLALPAAPRALPPGAGAPATRAHCRGCGAALGPDDAAATCDACEGAALGRQLAQAATP